MSDLVRIYAYIYAPVIIHLQTCTLHTCTWHQVSDTWMFLSFTAPPLIFHFLKPPCARPRLWEIRAINMNSSSCLMVIVVRGGYRQLNMSVCGASTLASTNTVTYPLSLFFSNDSAYHEQNTFCKPTRQRMFFQKTYLVPLISQSFTTLSEAIFEYE